MNCRVQNGRVDGLAVFQHYLEIKKIGKKKGSDKREEVEC